MTQSINPKYLVDIPKVSPLSGRRIIPTHIEDLMVGDVVFMSGVEITVGIKDLKSCLFLGPRFRGDGFMLGMKPVLVVDYSPINRWTTQARKEVICPTST